MKHSTAAYVDALCETARENRLTHAAIKKFLTILRRNNDISKLPEILRRFKTRYHRACGITNIEVISARDMKLEIEPQLNGYFGKNTKINFAIKPEIIGGIIAYINDETLIDASVTRRLHAIFKKPKI